MIQRRFSQAFALALTVTALGACQSIPAPDDGIAKVPTVTHAPSTATPATVTVTPSLDAIIPELAGKQVVFVGETHDRYEHHLVQLDMIRRLHAIHPDLAIGMEFFQRPFQPTLDAFIAGRLDEKTFLKKTQYFQRWGFDYRLYRPILDYARQQRIPVLALNAPAEISRKVGQVGLAGLSATDKAQIPAEIDRSDATYRHRLKQVYRQHGRKDGGEGFKRFWEVQLLWDETMAETAANYLKQHPNHPLVVLAGRGHLAYGAGIPRRLTRRRPVTTAIVITVDTHEKTAAGMADFLLVAEKVELPQAGRLGISMEKSAAGVRIQAVQADSGAAKAGLQRGDQITGLDGQLVTDPDDIQIALLDKRPGDPVKLLIRRPNGQEAPMNVVLGGAMQPTPE